MPTSSRRSRRGWSRSRSRASRRSGGASKTYASARQQFEQKIRSFQALKSQTSGAGSARPTPATLQKFANVVNKGGIIRQASTPAIQRASGGKKSCNTASSAYKALRSKYGAAIKAVAPAKGGKWLIAAAPTWKGRPFKFGQ